MHFRLLQGSTAHTCYTALYYIGLEEIILITMVLSLLSVTIYHYIAFRDKEDETSKITLVLLNCDHQINGLLGV